MKKIFLIIFILITNTYSFDKFAFEYGDSSNDIDVYGVSVLSDIDYELIKNTNLSWEFSLQKLNGKDDDLVILSTEPLLNYFLLEKLYIEAGIGLAYFSEKELDHKKFGTNLQFKESIGFGYKFSKNIDGTIKYTHYSNADINKDNAGIDYIGLRLIYSF